MKRGFTLLEVLVATLIMGIAVAGLLNGLATSSRNAARLVDYDRATLLAKTKMDELLMDHTLPRKVPISGAFDPSQTGGVPAGWQATVTIFETTESTAANKPVIDRIQLEIWWITGNTRHTFTLEGFRRSQAGSGDY